jgi:lysozyme
MQLDQAGIDLIKQFEGFRAFPYFDSANKLTIGYGHLIKNNESFPRDISIEEAEVILEQDAQFAVDAVNLLVNVPLSQNQFNSLVSFAFNLGGSALKKSTLLRLLNAGDYDGAGDEFKKWNKVNQGGVLVVSTGLVFRREKEAGLFLV